MQSDSYRSGRLLAAAVTLFAASLAAPASSLPARPSAAPAGAPVLAHLSLGDLTVQSILVRHAGRQTFLYLQQVSSGDMTIVNVTDPRAPAISGQFHMPRPSPSGRLETLGLNGAVIAVAATPASPTSLDVIDLSDPANPRVVRSFDNVTAYAPEPGRDLLYVVNNAGLWIVKPAQPPQDLGVQAWEDFVAAP